jgi:hypothetical protein
MVDIVLIIFIGINHILVTIVFFLFHAKRIIRLVIIAIKALVIVSMTGKSLFLVFFVT